MSVLFRHIFTSTNSLRSRFQSSIFNYEPQYFDRLITAILEFSQKEDPKSNVEAVFEYTRETGEPKVFLSICREFTILIIKQPVASVECFYDGETPPSGLFDEFSAIPHLWTRLDRTWEDRLTT